MGKKSIIVLDDDVGIREFLKGELEKSGYNVEAIASGDNFFEILSGRRPDLVLMDVSLPGMDGIALCHQMKNTPGVSSIPVIIMTAFPDKKTLDDAKTFGADDCINKPFSISCVKEKVEKILNKNNLN